MVSAPRPEKIETAVRMEYLDTESELELHRLFAEAYQRIINSRNVLIVTPNPVDPDSISSCCSLKSFLSLRGIKATLFSVKSLCQETDRLLRILPLKKFKNEFPPRPDCVILADYGSASTCGLDWVKFDDDCFFIGFDHHEKPADDFPKNGIQIVDSSAASTTALIYRFLKYLNVEITRKIATYVALGIYADTGRLTNFRADKEAWQIMAECIAKDIPWEIIRDAAKPVLNPHRLWIWSQLTPEVQFEDDGVTSVIVSRGKLSELRKANSRDLGSFLGVIQQIERTKIAMLLTEEIDGSWRVQIRSNIPREIPAAPLANILGGGGHANAAAAIWRGDPYDAVEKISIAISDDLKFNPELDEMT